MKKIFITLIISSVILFAFKLQQDETNPTDTASQKAVKETPPEGGEPKGFTLPEKDVYALENGLNVVLIPWGEIPKAQVSIIVKTGSIHESESQVGLSDILGDLLKEGTQTKSSEQIADEIAGMGGNVNITAGTHIFSVGSSVLYERVPDAINLLSEIVSQPLIPESELDRIKKDHIRNLNIQLSKPQPQAQEAFYHDLFPDHPYGRLFSNEETINGFTIENVKNFYDENFGAKRTTIYVVGKFDKQSVKDAVEALSEWKEGPEAEYPVAQPNAEPEISLIDRKDAPQSTLIMGLPVLDPSHPDYVALDVTNSILGGSFASRITSNIREDKGYTYSPNSTIDEKYKNGIWYEQADVTTDVTGASLREIAKEINLLREEPPSQEELEGIQNYEAGIFVLQNGTPGGIINQLVGLDIHDLDDSYLTDRVSKIYAVTPEKVQEMMDKYIDVDKMKLVIVGDLEKVKPQIEGYKHEMELENADVNIIN